MQKSINKRLGIMAVVALISFLFWIAIKPWILEPGLENSLPAAGWALLILFFVLSISVVGLAFYLLADHRYALITSVIIGGTYLLVFGVNLLFLAAFLVMVLSQFIAIDRIIGDIKGRITIHPRASISRGITFIVTSFLILVATAYYTSPAIQETAKTRELPLQMRQLIREVSSKVLSKEFEQLTPRERAQAEQQIEGQVSELFNDLIGPYREFVPFVLALLLFLLLQSVGILAVAFAAYGAGLLFKLLEKLDFVHIEERDVKAQRVVF
ncbi:MAG: hypothetical protein Q8P35_00020 [Candidatus Yanofskybacteria bacterium]|nr:hypothetical protein [Candidatus Yanofskybacteria bacterium]